MAAVRHDIYTGRDARGLVLLKCLCGFAVTRPTDAEARAAHANAIKEKKKGAA